MGRWEPNARGRLEEAALDLYEEHGFEQTTVADIAERAGLTKRTFFRHFADKREVLFSGTSQLREGMLAAAEARPDDEPPLTVVAHAVEAVAVFLQGRHARSRRRQAVINANPELQERELAKMAGLAALLTEALVARGTPEPHARLAAEAGIAVFTVAFARWVDAPGDPDFLDVVREAFADLRAVTAA